MRRAARIGGLLSVAACGTLAGHAVSYALEERSMADGRHGYFASLFQAVLALALFCGLLLIGRAVRARGDRRLCEAPAFGILWTMLSLLQVAGFATMEFAEGDAPDVTGCVVQAVVALVSAAVIVLFLGFVERHVVGSAGRYVRRPRACRIVHCAAVDALPALPRLAARVGFRHFGRPPPVFAYPSS